MFFFKGEMHFSLIYSKNRNTNFFMHILQGIYSNIFFFSEKNIRNIIFPELNFKLTI